MKKYLFIILGIIIGGVFSSFFLAGAVDLRVLFPSQGGTGTSTAPTTGQILVGQSSGIYAPQATSTLGLDSTITSSSLTIFNRSTCQTADYTATVNDVYICLTGTSTVTLVTAVNNAGRFFIVKDEVGQAATTSLMRVLGPSDQTIDGLSSTTFSSNYASVNLMSDGSNWFIW